MYRGSALVITLVVAGLLVVGGTAAYVATDGFGSQNDSKDTTTQQEVSTENEADNTESESAAALIRSAFEGGDAVTCTFTQDDGYAGTAYITSENNFRVDGQSDEGEAHMIKRGDSAYIWVEGESEGFEFSGEAFDEDFDEQFDTFNPEEFEEKAESNDVQDVDCQRATVDQSKFELPDNINFTSWSDVMQGFQGQQ